MKLTFMIVKQEYPPIGHPYRIIERQSTHS